jgi:tetratricopeptide (TPR) repeat protein
MEGFAIIIILFFIVCEIVKAGRFEEAVEIARSIMDGNFRVKALKSIAFELFKNGEREKAEKMFEEAIKIAKSIEDVSSRSAALRDIAFDLARAAILYSKGYE